MEKWTFRKYSSPRLTATAIATDPMSGIITLNTVAGDYEIEGAGGNSSAQELEKCLRSLMEQDSALWTELRGAEPGNVLSNLVLELDRLGLLEETASDSANGRSKDLFQAIDRALRFAMSARSASPDSHLITNARHLQGVARSLTNEVLAEALPELGLHSRRLDITFDDPIYEQDNFFLLTLELQLRNLKRNCPLALASVLYLLEQFDNSASADGVFPRFINDYAPLFDHLIGLGFDIKGASAYTLAFAELLVSSAGTSAKRVCRSADLKAESRSGLQFILHAEMLASDALLRLGPPRVLDAIKVGRAQDSLIKGCFIQEYQITARFVEIIAPLLPKRLSPKLRNRFFRYYGEEFGHEKFEMQTCRSLGIESHDLEGSSGLPLHQAFVDVFTYLGTTEPLAFMTSVFLTEGMTRAQSPLGQIVQQAMNDNQKFTAVCGQHESLNDDLNHPSLSRLLLADVPSISYEGQRRAAEYLLYLVELNYRTWEGLYDYYAGDDKPLHYLGPCA